MKTDSTSWSQLSAQIEQYRRRAKHNLEKYQKDKFNCLYRKKKIEQPSKQEHPYELVADRLGYSINMIREKQQEEKIKASAIVNKIGYLRVQRDRKIQSSERARQKMHRVLSIRSSSSQEKQLCQSEIRSFRERNQQVKKSLNERVKSERAYIEQQRKKILSQNSKKAHKARLQRQLNEQTIMQEKQAEVAEKQKMVARGKSQNETIIEKKREREKSIVQQGKLNHRNKIKQEFIDYQKAKRFNYELMTRFQSQSKRIMEETERAHRNLLNFQSVLLLGKKEKKEAPEDFKSPGRQITPHTNATNSESRSINKGQQKKLNNFFHLTN